MLPSAARHARPVLRPLAAAAAFALALTGASAPDAAQAQVTDSAPLRQHLVARRQALAAHPSPAPETLRAQVTAESRSGVRRLRIGEFQHLSDSDRDFAGYGLGAGSWDSAVAVLASAIADAFATQAALRGVPIDHLDVVVASYPDDPAVARTRTVSYPRNLTYEAHIDSPAGDAELEALRQAVERASPVFNLIAESQPLAHGEVFHTPSPAARDPNLPPGLRDFLVEKRAAILRRQARPSAPPPTARPGQPRTPSLVAHARIEPHTGLRQTRAAGFLFVHDSGLQEGGYDLATTTEQHQLGVLGTCLTHIFEIQAATRQVVLDSLELRLEAQLTPRSDGGARYRDIRYGIHVESPASTDEINALRDAVETVCPVYNLLKDPQDIRGVIVRGRYVPPAGA